jgi:hypothetical protein
MNTAEKQILNVEASEIFAGSDDDVALYDKAKATDDGYRISSEDLRTKYGI